MKEARCQNKGAYIVLDHPDFDAPSVHTFKAVTPIPTVLFPTYLAKNQIEIIVEIPVYRLSNLMAFTSCSTCSIFFTFAI